MLQVSTLDTVIFISYVCAVLIIGFIVGRKEQKQAMGYFLAGRSLPWYAIGFSMIATSISTEQFIGAGAKSYEVGMAVLHWEIGMLPSLTLLIFVFMPIYFRRRIFTIPEYLERRFSTLARTIFSVVTLASYLAINLAGVLFSGGYTLHKIFGIPLILGIWLLAVITGLYTIYGGLASVVWTDTLQAILLLGGGAYILFAGLAKIPGGFMAAVGTGERSHLFLPMDHPEMPWTGIAVLFVSTHFWYACTNQFYVQRCLGAKNEWHSRMGVVFACFLAIVLGFTVDFPGIVAFKLVELGIIPAPNEANEVYPLLIRYLVPSGVRGIIFAGLVAAIMSTLSSLINSIATLITMDFYKKFFRPESSEKKLIRVGQTAGGLILLAGTIWSPVVGTFPTIFDYFQQSWAILATPFAIIFLLGVFWKRANNTAAISTMILGIISIPVAFWLKRSVLPAGFSFYNLVAIVFVIQLTWMVAVSLLTRPQTSETAASAIWNIGLAKLTPEESPSPYPWYKSIVLWWSIAAILTIAIYIKFW
jgi:solute:Na+ symporter, SSS family